MANGSTKAKNALQDEGRRIFQAARSAARLLERTEPLLAPALSRAELRALAAQLDDVSKIASRYHLERASVGSLSPDAFPEPAA